MKNTVLEFLRRGIVAMGIGPLVLAVLYLILRARGVMETLSVDQVCIGIFSLSALAFVVGGINVVYHIERLPLMVAILIHGVVLYFGYLATYLLNDWLDRGAVPLLAFSSIFVVGYLTIWAVIYSVIKNRTTRLNKMLKRKQQIPEE